MPLSSFLVVDRDLTVVFYFSPALPPSAASSARDASLAHLLRVGGVPAAGAPPVSLSCDGVAVALVGMGELVYAAFASAGDDELAAVEMLDGALRVLAATCEESPPTPARVVSFFGKIVVCLHEAFGGHGYMFQNDVDVILRNSKLKAPLT